MTTTTKPGLYLRRKDGAASEPLNAATFHQIARTITDAVLDLEGLPIASPDKRDRMDRKEIAEIVQQATGSLSNLCDTLERVQDQPAPYTCIRCHGRGFVGPLPRQEGRQTCPRCGGAGLVEEVTQ